MLHVMKDLGRAQQRLGGDATPVEADAAEIVALDDRGRKTELRRADRGDVAAGPRANDDDVEGGISHAAFSCKGRRARHRVSGYRTYGASWAELEQARVPPPSTSSSNGGFNTCMPGTRPGMVSLDHCRFYAYRPTASPALAPPPSASPWQFARAASRAFQPGPSREARRRRRSSASAGRGASPPRRSPAAGGRLPVPACLWARRSRSSRADRGWESRARACSRRPAGPLSGWSPPAH